MRLLACLLFALLPPSRIEETTFEHLVIVSDVVCVGTVESVSPIATEARRGRDSKESEEPFRIAKLRISELWKGPQGVTSLAFVGSSTWTCDITGVEPGQKVLLLLFRWDEQSRAESVWAPELDARVGKDPFYSVCWAGRGQLSLLPPAEGQPPRVDLRWLPYSGEHRVVTLASLREKAGRILAANALGTAKHPFRKESAVAAILRQEHDEHGELKTSVVAALFEAGGYDEYYWSVAKSGAGAPFRRGFAKQGFRPVRQFPDLEGAEAFLDPSDLRAPFEGTRELIVTRLSMFSMTRAGVPLPDGAPKPIGPDAAERLLWNEMRRRILALIPKESEDAGDVKLELGG